MVVFVTPISNSSTLRGHQVLLLGSQEQLLVTCGDCSALSELFVSSAECFQGLATPNVSFATTKAVSLTASGTDWLALFDVTSLAPGRAYRLCGDPKSLSQRVLSRLRRRSYKLYTYLNDDVGISLMAFRYLLSEDLERSSI